MLGSCVVQYVLEYIYIYHDSFCFVSMNIMELSTITTAKIRHLSIFLYYRLTISFCVAHPSLLHASIYYILQLSSPAHTTMSIILIYVHNIHIHI